MSYTAIEPFFAPLSKPMIHRALALQEGKSKVPSPVLLRERMTRQRENTFKLMQPVVKSGEFTTEWMLSTLTQFTPTKKTQENTRPLSAEALSRWRETGLVVYQQKNIPDYDNGAALITMRLLVQDRERAWLPAPPTNARKHYFDNEPLWWAWRQDDPSAPIEPCSVPLPEDLSASALLWTDWLGAAWRPEWLRIGNLGCCRWAKTQRVNDTLLWDIQAEDLERWGIPISNHYKSALRNDVPLTLHTLATSALLLLATERMEDAKAFSLDSLPLAM